MRIEEQELLRKATAGGSRRVSEVWVDRHMRDGRQREIHGLIIQQCKWSDFQTFFQLQNPTKGNIHAQEIRSWQKKEPETIWPSPFQNMPGEAVRNHKEAGAPKKGSIRGRLGALL